jgi:hypothetical protein
MWVMDAQDAVSVCFYACPEPEAIVVYKKGYEVEEVA